MEVLVIDCETICARDISQVAGDALVLCSANTLTKLPIAHGKRVGTVAPQIPGGTNYLLISMLTKSLATTDVERVEAVTQDPRIGCMIQYLCKLDDVDCHVCQSLADVGICSVPAPAVKERESQQLKQAIYHLFIARKLLTLCAISTHLGVGARATKRAVDALTAERKIKHEQGQLWRLLD
ncbi:hypothetical protein ACED51_04555 [Photobacterium swingsii]|uniref:hypothetical protein n=1 Tax=Photobacterium swingsii TaxID=680026 RepID=UPI00352D305A